MKLAALAAAGLALALTPPAHAEINCVELGLVLQSGLSGFEQLKGAQREDVQSAWRASFSLPGAGECDVLKGAQGAWYYSCDDLLKSEAQGRSAFNANVAAVASCLTSWTRQPPGKSLSPGRILDSARFTGAGRDAGLTVDLEFVEFDDDGTGSLWIFSSVITRRPG
jgi:hypothetical protein